MGFTLLLWIALALTIFWAVGLHNRLMRLRAAAVEGATAFDKQAQSFIGMTQDFALDAPLLADLAEAADQLDLALKGLKNNPSAAKALSDCRAKYEQLQQLWVSLPEVDDAPPEQRSLWDEASASVQFARTAMNNASSAYNEALAQPPARWVAATMGFHAIGPL